MKSSLLSAQVVLKPSSLDKGSWVIKQFEKADFQTGPFVATSFSISGPVEQFENFFQVQADQQGSQPFQMDELPLSALDANLREHIESILFTRPPDFGPAQYC